MAEISGNWFQRRRAVKSAAKAANDAVLGAALSPDLYAKGVVPDTFEGRFHMATLHAALAIRAMLKTGDPLAKAVSDKLNTLIFDGFDHALRERGAGDSSIARKARKLGERYYGISAALIAALDSGITETVEDVIQRNAISQQGREPEMASYLLKCAEMLAAQPVPDLRAGRLRFD